MTFRMLNISIHRHTSYYFYIRIIDASLKDSIERQNPFYLFLNKLKIRVEVFFSLYMRKTIKCQGFEGIRQWAII